jgi:hypothetical protein
MKLKSHIYWLLLIGCLALCAGQNCNINLSINGPWNIDDGTGQDIPDEEDDSLVFTVAPSDLVLDCDDEDNLATVEDWLNGVVAHHENDDSDDDDNDDDDGDDDSGDDDEDGDDEDDDDSDGCSPISVTHDFTGLSDQCDAQGWVTTVTWTATDNCGNTVSASADLIIPNPDPPVITLTGSPTVVVERNVGTYTEQGAKASIGCGAALVPAVVGGDVVDTHTSGIYEVTYNYTDACGQAAEEVVRSVYVADPPTFTATPEDLTLDCDATDAQDVLSAWLAGAEAQADTPCGDATITYEIVGLADECSAEGWTVKEVWTATDECGLSSTASANLQLTNADPASIALVGPAEMTLECHVDKYVEQGAVVSLGCLSLQVPATVGGDQVNTDGPAAYEVTYELKDTCGHATETLTRTVTVVDTQAPEVTVGGPVVIWSPDHKYETFRLSDCVQQVTDACEGDLDVDEAGTILSVYSDEPEDVGGGGDGNTSDDIILVDHSTLMVRAERQGGGNGRVYGVSFEVVDSEGNEAADICYAYVPHDQSGSTAVDDGPAYTVTP